VPVPISNQTITDQSLQWGHPSEVTLVWDSRFERCDVVLTASGRSVMLSDVVFRGCTITARRAFKNH
jgi:hypothetical protein